MAEHGKVGRNHMIAGTGNTQAMYQQLRMGWQASWKPTDNHFCKINDTVNPVIAINIEDGLTENSLKDIASMFGDVVEVSIPPGASFAFIRFASNSSAKSCIRAGWIDGVCECVQPAKYASKEVKEWRERVVANGCSVPSNAP